MKPISQREAQRLRKRVAVLEDVLNRERREWAQEWLGGTLIGSVTWEPLDSIPVSVRTARNLGHAVVVQGDNSGAILFFALPLTKTEAGRHDQTPVTSAQADGAAE